MQHLTHTVRNIHPRSVWLASLRRALTVANAGLTLVGGPLEGHWAKAVGQRHNRAVQHSTVAVVQIGATSQQT